MGHGCRPTPRDDCIGHGPVVAAGGVLQFLAGAEPMLACDRQLVLPLATEAGLLDALKACLPQTLQPLANWTRTGKVELPNGDVRRQHWWSSRVTQVKAAALLEAATGRDVPRLEAKQDGKAGGWLSPPSSGTRALLHRGPLFQVTQVAPRGAPATSGLRGQTVPPMRRAG